MLTPSFSVAQTPLAPNLVVVTDRSTGSDVAVTQRRVYIQDNLGNYLVEEGTTTDYEEWPLGDTSITLDILTTDQAVSVTVEWLNSSDVVRYTDQDTFCLAEYNKQFFYYLTQKQCSVPGVVQDRNYDSNIAKLWTSIIGAMNAVEIGNDIAASQARLDRASELRLNEDKYF